MPSSCIRFSADSQLCGAISCRSGTHTPSPLPATLDSPCDVLSTCRPLLQTCLTIFSFGFYVSETCSPIQGVCNLCLVTGSLSVILHCLLLYQMGYLTPPGAWELCAPFPTTTSKFSVTAAVVYGIKGVLSLILCQDPFIAFNG